MPHFRFTETSNYLLYVPRSEGHVLVKLTLLHDRTDIPFIKTAFLEQATTLLSMRACLPDKAEVTLSMTDILLFLIQRHVPSSMGFDD